MRRMRNWILDHALLSAYAVGVLAIMVFVAVTHSTVDDWWGWSFVWACGVGVATVRGVLDIIRGHRDASSR